MLLCIALFAVDQLWRDSEVVTRSSWISQECRHSLLTGCLNFPPLAETKLAATARLRPSVFGPAVALTPTTNGSAPEPETTLTWRWSSLSGMSPTAIVWAKATGSADSVGDVKPDSRIQALSISSPLGGFARLVPTPEPSCHSVRTVSGTR